MTTVPSTVLPTVLSIAITDSGRQSATQLPFSSAPDQGTVAATLTACWGEADGLVLFCSAGIAVRTIAPLLDSKSSDPAVVVVDENAQFVVALLGGHASPIAANTLATQVAELLGATPVLTTATDSSGSVALDTLAGFVSSGDIAGVTRSLLDGETVHLVNTRGWPVPNQLNDQVCAAETYEELTGPHIVVSDEVIPPASNRVVLNPPSLVVGIGASTNAPAESASDLLESVLTEHGLASASVSLLATIDRRAPDPVVTSLGHEIRAFRAQDLSTVAVPTPSDVVLAEVGTASVCEAAALLGGGPEADLVVPKQKALTSTVAIARRLCPEGEVHVVGLGPGDARHRTPQADAAIRHADVVIGYSFYVDQCVGLTSPSQEVLHSPIGAEIDRCREAVKRASEGQRVALVCSGDPGIFAMASLVLEVAPDYGNPSVTIVPGVTASLGASAILGAPLAHDHALVSLSDLLTPWEVIERRLHALAEADMAVAFYNPRSQRRITQLEAAKTILSGKRPASTPVGIVVNATREGQRVILTTLGEMDPADVDMFSIVVVGSSTSYFSNGRIVTPRGYDA